MPGTIRQACRVLPPLAREAVIASDAIADEHPSLVSALRGLEAYNRWVSEKVLVIASKWIDENREQVTKDMTAEEMDDMGSAIDAAYRLLEASDWFEERQNARKNVPADFESNPLWRRKNEQ